MPNHITNKLTAPARVIQAMTNAQGHIDFNLIQSFTGPHRWEGHRLDAETAAENACNIPASDHPLLRNLQMANRAEIDIRKMDDECFEQTIGMISNYRATGYLHAMEFQRAEWGTKWNAYESKIEPDQTSCRFDTAWSCPVELLKKLSAKFPEDELQIQFADEDIGNNCGTIVIKAGEITEQLCAPRGNIDEAERRAWRVFAAEIKGYELEQEDEPA